MFLNITIFVHFSVFSVFAGIKLFNFCICITDSECGAVRFSVAYVRLSVSNFWKVWCKQIIFGMQINDEALYKSTFTFTFKGKGKRVFV